MSWVTWVEFSIFCIRFSYFYSRFSLFPFRFSHFMTFPFDESHQKADVDLVAELSHEFQSPLAILRGNLELLENEDGLRNRRAVRVMAATIERLARLVSRTLESARLNAVLPSRNVINVSALLESVYDDCAVLAEDRRIVFMLTESVVATFDGDFDQMKQVLLNLVSNALQHTKPGGLVQMKAAVADALLEISVADTGCGIAPDNLPHVFERFYRIGESRPGFLGDIDARGAGLGLYIARQVVEAHGGSVDVRSEAGKGSVFTVRLPASKRASVGAPADVVS